MSLLNIKIVEETASTVTENSMISWSKPLFLSTMDESITVVLCFSHFSMYRKSDFSRCRAAAQIKSPLNKPWGKDKGLGVRWKAEIFDFWFSPSLSAVLWVVLYVVKQIDQISVGVFNLCSNFFLFTRVSPRHDSIFALHMADKHSPYFHGLNLWL